MAVLALIRNHRELGQVLPLAAEVAQARDTSVCALCWQYAEAPPPGGESRNSSLSEAASRYLQEHQQVPALARLSKYDNCEIRVQPSPDATESALEIAKHEEIQFLVATADDQDGAEGATYATNSLLKKAPCSVAILFGGPARTSQARKIFVLADDNPHDGAALFLAHQLVEANQGEITLARTEADYEDVNIEVGQQGLNQLIRDTGLEDSEHIECQILRKSQRAKNARTMDAHDLVLVGANSSFVSTIIEFTRHPAVAVIKRAPALKPWRHGTIGEEWNPLLSPADYADLLGALRRGSLLTLDFLIMLGLATIVASMGLLQDSPAVVIGSMLLAPLMTPMLGCGMALAQANPKLGNTSLASIGSGTLLTVLISFVIGVLTPGVELTPQIYARGAPNVLDLVIAAASGAAAAYASARPNLVGSIAGVAIATALVPPLCSVGISIAYLQFGNANGAALLFLTNFIAIVLFAALTFRSMGVRTTRTRSRQRRWVAATVAVMALVTIVLLGPLKVSLVRDLLQGKPKPNLYPLSRTVIEPLKDYVEENPDVEILTAGRPASPYHRSDVVLVIGAPFDLDRQYAQELINIVRREMRDPNLKIEVHCVRELWQESSN
ncbi:DUF389 domain-containing protein [Microbulbifer sp. YPW16]|uniref:DUF389 domain-containing protein n=1 Tax=Microbulbifer sp. YPW16 TaxID=2904242 RepID=UPI001E3E5590|nr:DUF389 domain-containing protein [Microbulbifer sp. YPW16]UHQ55705.1 DUF389 domain-containing protein [Microbulbifer sp. YPW16]